MPSTTFISLKRNSPPSQSTRRASDRRDLPIASQVRLFSLLLGIWLATTANADVCTGSVADCETSVVRRKLEQLGLVEPPERAPNYLTDMYFGTRNGMWIGTQVDGRPTITIYGTVTADKTTATNEQLKAFREQLEKDLNRDACHTRSKLAFVQAGGAVAFRFWLKESGSPTNRRVLANISVTQCSER